MIQETNDMRKKQHSGFTLIELIIVIVILGILSVVVAPKFINLSTEANIAALQGVESSLQSASNLVNSKARISNQSNGSIDIDNDGIDDVAIIFGYPSAHRSQGIINAIELDKNWLYGDGKGNTEFYVTNASFADGRSGETNNNIQITSNKCYLIYYPAAAVGESPSYSYVTSEC